MGYISTITPPKLNVMKRIQAITEDNTKDKKNKIKTKKAKRKNKPKNQKQRKNKKNKQQKQAKKPETKKNKNKTMGITRPKANKPMSKRRRTKYNDKNFHVQYFITAPKQQSNNAKECQHQNNVAGGLGRGLGPLGPQGPLGPGPGPRPHYFDVGTLLHCLIAALEL